MRARTRTRHRQRSQRCHRLVQRFEGAGLDGVVAKPIDFPCHPDKRVMLKWEPLRTELVFEVAHEHMQSVRFRHMAHFRCWRTDRKLKSCTFAQLEVVIPERIALPLPIIDDACNFSSIGILTLNARQTLRLRIRGAKQALHASDVSFDTRPMSAVPQGYTVLQFQPLLFKQIPAHQRDDY
jgi:hypothetical protein